MSPKQRDSNSSSMNSIELSPHSVNDVKREYSQRSNKKQIISNMYDIMNLSVWNKYIKQIDSDLEYILDVIYNLIKDKEIKEEYRKYALELTRKKFDNNRNMYNSLKDVPIVKLTKKEKDEIYRRVEEDIYEYFKDVYPDVEDAIEDLKTKKYDIKRTISSQNAMIKDEFNKLQSKLLIIQLEDYKDILSRVEYLLDKALQIKFFIKMVLKPKFNLSTSDVGKRYIDNYIKGIIKYL
jgi:hypothetical protein